MRHRAFLWKRTHIPNQETELVSTTYLFIQPKTTSTTAIKLRIAWPIICDAGRPATSMYTCVAMMMTTPIQKDQRAIALTEEEFMVKRILCYEVSND